MMKRMRVEDDDSMLKKMRMRVEDNEEDNYKIILNFNLFFIIFNISHLLGDKLH
jgi:hypothetical protein